MSRCGCSFASHAQNCFMRKSILFVFSAIAALSSSAQGNLPSKTETRVIIRDGGLNDGQKPLVVIDGKPGGDLQSISPDKIVRMDVLKGSSAYDMFGPEGKNGVIVITTKSAGIADTLAPGTRKVERTVRVNTFKMSDGKKDTTIIQADSVVVTVDGEKIIVNGKPVDIKEQRIVKGFALPNTEGMTEQRIVEGYALPRMEGMSLDRDVFLFDADKSMRWEIKSSPKLGLSVQDTEDGKGVQVLSLTANSAAAKAGILANDRILAIDQTAVNGVDALKRAIDASSEKRSVMVHLQRGKKDMHIELVFPRELKKADL
ncbi:MAG: hypothetical protein RL750_6 [Bacteroidota bacterium]